MVSVMVTVRPGALAAGALGGWFDAGLVLNGMIPAVGL